MKNIILISILILISAYAKAQYGYSSASVSMNRATQVFSPDQVIIEEYINYHTHKIDLPKNNEEVALSLAYNQISKKKFILQVGIATKQIIDYSEMPPVNISLVIDRSGSMQSNNKLEKVKKALLKFIKGLRPEDYISIITYESEAKVVLPSQKVKEIGTLENTIESIVAAGSTNLYDGLILGYKEVKKQFNPSLTNKVILLTDGIANEGITDTEEIVKDSYAYNKEGIDVSTIGVGSDLNYSLLQQLANKGKGANHFIGDHKEDIIKVFDTELESILSAIGKQVYLEIEVPNDIKVNQIYGYEPEYRKNQIKIPLKNISNGLTQVVLLELSLSNEEKVSPIKTKLSYLSSSSSKTKEKIKKMTLEHRGSYNVDNNEIVKNYHIANMAMAMKEMAKKASNKDYETAENILSTSLKEVEKKFPYVKDKDIIRIKKILLKNQCKLKEYITAYNTISYKN